MPVRRRPAATEDERCGVQEQPTGYTCNRPKGHRGLHACIGPYLRPVVQWDGREEWHGPVLHGADGARATHTYCGERAGTPEHPVTYTPRLVRCRACLAVLTPSEGVVPARRSRRRA